MPEIQASPVSFGRLSSKSVARGALPYGGEKKSPLSAGAPQVYLSGDQAAQTTSDSPG